MLIKCPECGREVSDKATACPQCGCPIVAEPAPAGTAAQPPESLSADSAARQSWGGNPFHEAAQAKLKARSGADASSSSRTPLYVLLAVAGVVAIGIFAPRCDSSLEQRRFATRLAEDSVAARRVDSARAELLLTATSRTRGQTLLLDELLHQGTRPEHALIHPLAVDAALDSASGLLTERPRPVDAVYAASRLLGRVTAPMSPEQESRLRQLQSLARTARADVVLDSASSLLTRRAHTAEAVNEASVLLSRAAALVSPEQDSRLRRLRLLERTARAGVARQSERAAAELRRLNESAKAESRRQFASALERNYLSQGMDVTVRTSGQNATTLRVTWILVSRPMAYQLSDSPELFSNLRNQGFRRFEISDGYDHSWYWKLD